MPRKSLVECDGCGQQQLENEAGDWLEIKVAFVKSPDTATGPTIVVDSWDCLGRYAERRAREQVPDHA